MAGATPDARPGFRILLRRRPGNPGSEAGHRAYPILEPAPFVMKPLARLALFGLIAATLSGCDTATVVPFRAVALASGDAPLYRNQNVEIVFSRPLAEGYQPHDALILRDRRGRAVPYRLRAKGSLLSLAPLDPRGWPETDFLQLEILFPFLGSSFRGAEGEENQGGFQRRIALRRGYLRRPGVLRLLHHNLRAREEEPLDTERPLVLAFNAPLDARTLRQGIKVIAREPRQPLREIEAEIRLDDDPSIALIPPIDRRSMMWRPGLRYEIRLTRELRSLDGRELVDSPSARILSFQTQASDHGTLVFRFQDEEDVDPACTAAVSDGTGVLGPHLVTLNEPLFLPGRGPWHPRKNLFGREASRAQILLDGPLLPRQPCIIEKVHFHLDAPLTSVAVAGVIRIAMGYWKDGAPLEWSFAANEARMVDARPISLETAELGQAGRPFITFHFRNPFIYDGSGRRLLLDLRSETRLEDNYGQPMVVGIQGLAGGEESPPSMLIHRGRTGSPDEDADAPLRTSFRPRMIIQTKFMSPVVTRWYEVEGVLRPHFERQPGS